ncbi:MAG TPA: MFS transporter [Acidimicrobiales bacterium]|nr:MFS transporter [Acidimicrobiales bacterium]
MRVVTERRLTDAQVDAALRPRRSWLCERDEGGGRFGLENGPFHSYERVIELGDAQSDGSRHVRQTVTYSIAIDYVWFLFALSMRRLLRKLPGNDHMPWWMPPDVLDGRAATTLGCLALLSYATGSLSVLLSQTLTYAADQFRADTGAQGVAVAFVRADVLVALVFVWAADRRGRRWALLSAGLCAALGTVASGLTPSLPWFALAQIVARGGTAAAALLIGIMLAEEMPASARAWSLSFVTIIGALGAGVPIFLLFLADTGPNGWRLLFGLGFLTLPALHVLRRSLPESRRFGQPHVEAAVAGHGRRFWLLAVSGFLLAVFIAPAASFTNEYLRTEQGFSAARISLFTILTNIPGGVGIVIGGILAERGRRMVGALAVLVGTGATVLMFLFTGWPLWAWSVVGAVLGAATVPALGVYGPELFPTSLRGRANGIITGLSRLGSVLGLIACGFMARRFDALGPSLAVLAIGPAMLALLIVAAYPETAHLELEDINPEDAPISETPAAPAPSP